MSIKVKLLIVFVTLIVLSCITEVVILGMNRTIVSESHYVCRICRAGRYDKKTPITPLVSHTYENAFSRYFRSSIDPSHQHDWSPIAGNAQTGLQFIRGIRINVDYCRSGGIYWLDDQSLITILKTLPDARSRKLVIDRICIDYHSTNYKQAEQMQIKLHSDYQDNPKRKDWPVLLRKYGLY